MSTDASSRTQSNSEKESKSSEELQRQNFRAELGSVNRYWYRDCLDRLSSQLKQSGRNPSTSELRKLCDTVLSGFLKAVCGQAEFASQEQLAADRAYFIPFRGDHVGRFNFAKSYYQVPPGMSVKHVDENGNRKELEHSLWSYLPRGGQFPTIKIDGEMSVSREDIVGDYSIRETNNFEQMIAVAERFRHQDKQKKSETDNVKKLKKSLILRDTDGEDVDIVRLSQLFEKDPDEKMKNTPFIKNMKKDVGEAAVALFTVYEKLPGNAGVEIVLLNHLHVLHWIIQQIRGDDVCLAQRESDYEVVLQVFLRAYFLRPGSDIVPDPTSSVESDDLISQLKKWIDNFNSSQSTGDNNSADGLSEETIDRLLEEEDSEFLTRLLSEETSDDAEPFIRTEATKRLLEMRSHLFSFVTYFLTSESESRLEDNLSQTVTVGGGDFLRAGSTRESFVWVCRDFARPDQTLPRNHYEEEVVDPVWPLLHVIARPYRRLFQALEIETLKPKDRREAIDSYWRALGQVKQRDKVFASFEAPSADLSLLKNHYQPAEDPRPSGSLDPRAQNVFTRVRICDSFGEPLINGLFVFTTDHDEFVYKNRDEEERSQSVFDLLAFAKVYFFIVRDYIEGLDRAREAIDIGSLNSHLYDQMLDRLNDKVSKRLAEFESEGRDILSSGNLDRLMYEVINNYANSLIDQPPYVKRESFPFDRMLVLPMHDQKGDVSPENEQYLLPMYVFQAIYFERSEGRVSPESYSLIRPFGSPIEKARNREIGVRSFQRASHGKNQTETHISYLEKRYLSERFFTAIGSTSLRSAVVKLASRDNDDEASADKGRKWITDVLSTFWRETTNTGSWLQRRRLDPDQVWKDFLIDLTRSLKEIREPAKEFNASKARQRIHWFQLRFSLLRTILANTSSIQGELIEKRYQADRRLLFGSRDDLDIIRIAKNAIDPLAESGQLRQLESFDQLAVDRSQFEPVLVPSGENLIVRFLSQLTNSASNIQEKSPAITWYQPTLTEPVDIKNNKDNSATPPKSVHLRAAELTTAKGPDYKSVTNGEDTINMLMGEIGLTVAKGQREERQLKYLIVLLRDFQDRTRSEDNNTLNELTLYTRTFFANLERQLQEVVRRRELRRLSNDVTQIGRNWHSVGINNVVVALLEKIQEFVETAKGQMGHMKREFSEHLFESILELVIAPQHAKQQRIELESCAFDRLVHIPLFMGESESSIVSYQQTTIRGEQWDNEDNKQTYDRIRELGRVWDSLGGEKIPDGDPIHVDQNPSKSLFESSNGTPTPLGKALAQLEVQSNVDELISMLYEADRRQAVAIAGLVNHLLRGGEKTLGTEWGRRKGYAKDRIRALVEDQVRILDRDARDDFAFTDVYMGRGLQFRAHLHDVQSLPFFKEFFESIKPDSYQYGLSEKTSSRVVFVFYSIGAPPGLTENHVGDDRYRGVFCFVVDDESTINRGVTTANSTSERLSDAETTEQEDIRTLIHNVMSSVRLVLGQQALQDQIHQPGTEQFIIGMLHRLKNELSIPRGTLHSLSQSLGQSNQTASEISDLRQEIESAEATIKGIGDLFKHLKELTEIGSGEIPKQVFSSSWLGWVYVSKLCSAMQKLFEASHVPEVREHIDRIESLGDEARRALDSFADINRNDSELGANSQVDEVQIKLFQIQEIWHQAVKLIDPQMDGQRVSFSFQVYAAEQINFVASYLIDEAVGILVENGLQALWLYLRCEKEDGSRADNGRMSLVFRPHDTVQDEVVLTFVNSTTPIHKDVEKTLNDPTPQPLSTHTHERASAKKGGSGYGHYYARRIVKQYCGGREKRRKLDIQLKFEDNHDLAVVSVNLLTQKPEPPKNIQIAELLRLARTAFDDSQIKEELSLERFDTVLRSKTIRWPGNLVAKQLFTVIRRVLDTDRRFVEDRLFSFMQDNLCEKVNRGTNLYLKRLRTALEQLQKESDVGADVIESVRRDLNGCRRGSFADLKSVMQDWSVYCGPLFAKLPGYLNDGESSAAEDWAHDPIRAEHLLRDTDRGILREQLLQSQYSAHLNNSVYETERDFGGLLRELDTDEDGSPIPSRKVLNDVLLKPQWQCGFEQKADGEIAMAFRLYDGQTSEKLELQTSPNENAIPPKEMCNLFSQNHLGRVFFQQHEAFALSGVGANESLGKLWFESRKEQDIEPSYRTIYLVLNETTG